MMSPDLIKEQLQYCPRTGNFTWIHRPSHHFRSEIDCRAWNAKMAGKRAGTIGPRGYVVINIKPKRQYAHRLAWLYVYGELPSSEIDHINGVRSDNRIENLRSVTSRENRRNQRIRSDNTSGVPGVTWLKGYNVWRATIGVSGRTVPLGRFPRLIDAVAARKEAERALGFHPNHGRFKP